MIMVEIVFDSAAYGTVYAWKTCELHEDVKTIRMVNLEFMLSYGYLSEGIESDYRIKLPLKMIMAGTGEKWQKKNSIHLVKKSWKTGRN